MPAPDIQKMGPIIAVLMTREQSLEALRQNEMLLHEGRLEDLQRDYRQRLKGEQRRHASYLADIQLALEGKPVPGICHHCGQNFRTFRQWDDYEQCPRCGADLSGGLGA